MIEYLIVGKMGRPHGLKGEGHVFLYTDFPERLKPGVVLFVGEDHVPLTIRSSRWKNDVLLLAFEDYHSREAIAALRNQYLYVRADDRPPLPEGEYYHHQLLGLKVFSRQEEDLSSSLHFLGHLTEILSTGANDVYVITNDEGKEILIPALESTIYSIHLDQGEMVVNLLPGILD